MHPYVFAESDPTKPAIIMAGTAETLTYADLERRSNQGAQLFRKVGLKPGDAIAIFLDNSLRYLELCWAAQRSGLYFTCISSRLTAGEVRYIVQDCGAKILLVSHALASVAAELAPLLAGTKGFSIGGPVAGYEGYEDAAATMPTQRLSDETAGAPMLYSSGTTGRPKGVRTELSGLSIDAPVGLTGMIRDLYGVSDRDIYLSPAPLYHSAPLAHCMAIHRLGGTVIVMEKFDAEAALRTIDRFGVTVSQWVPTMFVRMLKLPAEAKDSFNLSSQRVAIHAAAPCPINVKQQMIEWWGPVLHEYYAGTEGIGFVYVNSHDWLRHPGTVGKPLVGILHICNEAGEEVANGEEGVIYFESASRFRYHNDPKKTAESRHPQHPSWATLGDVGKLDAEGFLYLTDRKAFMIISGGVNIYPQEAENLLITHPKVADAAVVGVPNDDLGEEVKAVIQPMNWADATPELASELIDYCRARLANIKCPRSIDFEQDLPRQPTGKLYKRLIRDRYWHQRTSRIV